MSNLQANWQLLRTTRAATLEMVRELQQDQLARRPAAGGWSLLEILDHLLLSGELYRKEIAKLVELARAGRTPFIRKTVQEIDFAPNFLPKAMLPLVDVPFSMMTLFVPPAMRDLMIRYSGLLKGQTPEIARPRPGKSGTELVADLERSLSETEALLRENAALPWDRMRIQHPLLGVNSVPQLLRLTAMHEKRHQDQMRKVLAEVLRRAAA